MPPSISLLSSAGVYTVSQQAEQKGTVEGLEELYREYPEVVSLATKLSSGRQLSKNDILMLREVAEAMGWDEDDAAEELKNLAANPSKRVEKYMELFQKYYSEPHKLLERGALPTGGRKAVGSRNSPHQATRRPQRGIHSRVEPRQAVQLRHPQRRTQTSLPRHA
jgi:hypothetical protein